MTKNKDFYFLSGLFAIGAFLMFLAGIIFGTGFEIARLVIGRF